MSKYKVIRPAIKLTCLNAFAPYATHLLELRHLRDRWAKVKSDLNDSVCEKVAKFM